MDLIVDLIDQLIKERIKIALSGDQFERDNPVNVIELKERLRCILVENIPNK